jgi:hypothetical protein
MTHTHWLSKAHHDSQPLAQIMVCFTEPVVVNHDVYCWESDFESRWVLLYQWLLIMVCIAEQVIVNYGEFTVSMVVNDGVLCWEYKTP